MPHRLIPDDLGRRQLAEFARKKLLVDARKCVQRSKALIQGSRDLIAATREMHQKRKKD